LESDIELLDAWRAGDKRAGETLIERHFDALYRFLRNKVSDPAEDLVQTTLLQCVAYRDRLQDGASFRAYMFRIARNELYDHLKRRHRGEQPTDFASMSIEDLGPSPSAVLAGNQQQRVLALALRRIPVDFQVLLELHYWESLTAQELADVFDVPVGTLKNRIRRGKELLRRASAEIAAGAIPPETTDDDLDAWVASLRAHLGTG
jgi:RNA polymerase sigma-70 factor (ECF subfamily)